MKLSMLLLFSSIAILMTGCTTPQEDSLLGKPVPEATNLNSKKYTLRFVRATGGDGPMFESAERISEPTFDDIESTFSSKPHITNEWSTFRIGDEPLLKRNILLAKIEQANPTYTELVSMPIEIGKEFSSDNGLLKGTVWRRIDPIGSNPDQGAVMSYELKYDGLPIKHKERQIKVGEWICDGIGRSNRVEWVLFKLYEPQK